MKKYVKPEIEIINIHMTHICEGSYNNGGYCNEWCKLWHVCLDRDTTKRKWCEDKKLD